MVCVCVHMSELEDICHGGQRTTCGSWISPFTTWALESFTSCWSSVEEPVLWNPVRELVITIEGENLKHGCDGTQGSSEGRPGSSWWQGWQGCGGRSEEPAESPEKLEKGKFYGNIFLNGLMKLEGKMVEQSHVCKGEQQNHRRSDKGVWKRHGQLWPVSPLKSMGMSRVCAAL